METPTQEHINSPRVEGGEQPEKKTVMNKMKDRARKMKNTFNKMAHGHSADGGHENEHDNDAMSEEEEVYEEVEEEREADTEVQGAPKHESEAAGQFAGGRGENLGPGKEVHFGEAKATTAVDQAPSGPKENRIGTTAASDESELLYPSTATGTAAGERRNLISDQDENIDEQKIALTAMAGTAVEEDHFPPKAKTGTPAAATQLDHPTGGDEVGESPIVSYLQAMAVTDKPKGAEGVLESPPTVTHDQLSPDKPQQDTPKEGTEEQKSSSYTDKISSTATTAEDATHDQLSPDKTQQDTPKEGTEEQKSSSYTDKISSTATTADDATHDQLSPDKTQQDTPEEGTEEQKSSSYTDMISSAAAGSAGYGMKFASAVYGKVSGAGTAIMGKGTTEEEKNDDIKTGQPGQPEENGVSAAE